MARSIAKDFPTKEEIKAARAVMRKVFAARRAKYRKRSRRRRPLAASDRAFYMWMHDMRVALQSSAREISISPTQVAGRARAVADAMAAIIAERKPQAMGGRSQRTRSTVSQRHLSYLWQEMFDSMIHEMAAKSELLPHVIVDRARRIADAAISHLKKRAKR
jgi:hypothetical protein